MYSWPRPRLGCPLAAESALGSGLVIEDVSVLEEDTSADSSGVVCCMPFPFPGGEGKSSKIGEDSVVELSNPELLWFALIEYTPAFLASFSAFLFSFSFFLASFLLSFSSRFRLSSSEARLSRIASIIIISSMSSILLRPELPRGDAIVFESPSGLLGKSPRAPTAP